MISYNRSGESVCCMSQCPLTSSLGCRTPLATPQASRLGCPDGPGQGCPLWVGQRQELSWGSLREQGAVWAALPTVHAQLACQGPYPALPFPSPNLTALCLSFLICERRDQWSLLQGYAIICFLYSLWNGTWYGKCQLSS
uniref:Uncharacterized protein n=1 Tax=Rousettus aegyptiacus TaxID=9407 RepID=A0A7J8CIC9_ROUAE|nr:hypothetical protein HJG63_009105 [Rousettus aegyptiacus]